jgi:hypothetical protein
MASKKEAWEAFFDSLAEADLEHDKKVRAQSEITAADAAKVEAALDRCDRALRHLLAMQRALPAELLFRGGYTESGRFKRTVDRTSDAFRALKQSWRARDPYL